MALSTEGLAEAGLFYFPPKTVVRQCAVADNENDSMGNMEIPVPPWQDGDEGEIVPTSIPGGLLDGLPGPYADNSLHLLMDPWDIATIDGLSPRSSGGQDEGEGNLATGQLDPGVFVPGQNDGSYLPIAGPKDPIGPVRGYPETGKDAWRAGNDDAITAATNKYNSERYLFPGDAEYMTPQLMKAWQMRESGGSPEAFKTDPFQVNKLVDWPKTGEKTRIAGLSKGQQMTPETSADAALKWLHYKGHVQDKKWVPYQGPYEALRNYNAAPGSINGIPNADDYANTVLGNAWASYGDWQK